MRARKLQFGSYAIEAAPGAGATPYFLAGPKLYAVGMANGTVAPIGAEHLVGDMGGVWAHPLKVADGLSVALADTGGAARLVHHLELVEAISHLEWLYELDDLRLRRRDCVAGDAAGLVVLLDLTNTSSEPQAGELQITIALKFLGCWFGGLPSGGGEYWREGALLLGHGRHRPAQWGVACGAGVLPARCEFVPDGARTLATLAYSFELAPGASVSWEFALAAEHEHGPDGARHVLDALTGRGEALLAGQIGRYERAAFGGVALSTPDAEIDQAFAFAKANLELLRAEYAPSLPPYFLAGIPEYPQLFGCDTEYTIPGAAAAGFADTCRSALLALASYGARACGRIPHEITTNGRVFHPGNTQETPQFAIACWDYFRWTGDGAFLEQVFPLCQEGIDQYMPGLWSAAGGLYPIGDGVVERPGMGARKLDSTCYLFGALRALHDMAAALGCTADAARYGAQATTLAAHFEQDWWLEGEGLYADSLHTDMRPQLDGHWTVVLPIQLGLAAPERARRALARIEREWVNEWGLVHTRGREDSVWTLPTGLLALAAFRHGQASLGLQLLRNIAETTRHGALGAFKELIPIGLCFVQLWSAGLYLQGAIEGLLGIAPLAHRHELRVAPCLPAAWPFARVSGLRVGAHQLDVEVRHDGIELVHCAGPAVLQLRYRLPAAVEAAPDAPISDGGWLTLEAVPGETLRISVAAGQLHVQRLPVAVVA